MDNEGKVNNTLLKQILKQTNQIGHAHTKPIRDRLARMDRRDDAYTATCREFRRSVRVARRKEALHLEKVIGPLLCRSRASQNSKVAFRLAHTPDYEIEVNRRIDPRSGVRYVVAYDAGRNLIGASHSETGGIMGGVLIGMIILQEHGLLDENWIHSHIELH